MGTYYGDDPALARALEWNPDEPEYCYFCARPVGVPFTYWMGSGKPVEPMLLPSGVFGNLSEAKETFFHPACAVEYGCRLIADGRAALVSEKRKKRSAA